MYTTEDYEFRKDIFSSLIRISDYRIYSFFSKEQKTCNNDFVFFTSHIDTLESYLTRALKNRVLNSSGKEQILKSLSFIESFNKVKNDEWSYQFFRHNEKLDFYIPFVLKSIDIGDSRFNTAFKRYWKRYCLRSIKVMYYLHLTTNHTSAKYDGLGPVSSQIMYKKIQNAINEIKKRLTSFSDLDTRISTLNIESQLDFITFVYNNVVAIEHPKSAKLLNDLRGKLSSEKEFFGKLFIMDKEEAKKVLCIGVAQAKEVTVLCDKMRRIIFHPSAYNVFCHSEKVNLTFPIIQERMKSEHIRIFNSFKKFIASCNNSITIFYLRVVGCDSNSIKFDGLNHNKSKEVLNIYKTLLTKIEDIINDDSENNEVKYRIFMCNLNIPITTQDTILDLAKKIGHFPYFSLLSHYVNMSCNKQDKTIYTHTLNIFDDNKIIDLDTVATSMKLTRERVRQLREKCYKNAIKISRLYCNSNILGEYQYNAKSKYEFNYIREIEQVKFSNEYITICISNITPNLKVIGNIKESLFRNSGSAQPLYLVPSYIAEIFDFNKFIESINTMLQQKRFYSYRDDLETFVRGINNSSYSDENFYEILRACRQVLEKGYPNNIINSQLYFPENSRKSIPLIIEDILREFNRPMTAKELCDILNDRFQDINQVPNKIGVNALRNPKIIAISRSSTYTLAEWDNTRKRGGTIRNLAAEYLNSLEQPIAPLTSICNYISKFRKYVKESSVKNNLLSENNNRFCTYHKGKTICIGYANIDFGHEYKKVEITNERRSFSDSIKNLEQFIKTNGHYPFSSNVDSEELRLCRFYFVVKSHQKKGKLEPQELAEIERIDKTYGHLRVKKERATWNDRLEQFVNYVQANKTLPHLSSKEYTWFKKNKLLYDLGKLKTVNSRSFSILMKVLTEMNLIEITQQ